MEKFICKAVASPFDNRDWDASEIYQTPIQNTTVDLRPSLPAIRNQGRQGTCAAHTASCMKEWQEGQDYNFQGYMSPQFIYNNRQNQDTDGMFGRDVMRILSTIGSVEELDYNYGRIEAPGDIDPEYFDRAAVHKIKAYARVLDINTLKQALSINGPCYIAFPVYNNSIRLWKQGIDDALLGGHAMAVVGYTAEGFIIRNTWGEQWGDKGYCIYDFADWGAHWEIWTTIDAKSYFKPDDSLSDADDSDDEFEPREEELGRENLCKKLLTLLRRHIS